MTFIIKIETAEDADVRNLSLMIKDRAVDMLMHQDIEGVSVYQAEAGEQSGELIRQIV